MSENDGANDGVVVDLEPRRKERDPDPYFARIKKEDERLVALVLAARLIPRELSTVAELTLAEPVDFEDRRGKLRLSKVRVRADRLLGPQHHHPDEDDSPIYARVYGWVQTLTAKDESHARRDPFWTNLPDDLAEILLVKAMTSP